LEISKVKHNNLIVKVKRISYTIAPEEIIKQYEAEKFKFVSDLNESFVKTLQEEQTRASIKMARYKLTDVEKETYELISSRQKFKRNC